MNNSTQQEGRLRPIKASERLPEIDQGNECTEIFYVTMDGDKELARYWKVGNEEYFMSLNLRLYRKQWFDRVYWFEGIHSSPPTVSELKSKFAEHLGEKGGLNDTDAHAVEWTAKELNK